MSNALSTPLAEFHRKNGAHMGSWFGCELPDNFGDWLAEYRYLQQTVGLLDKNYRAYLEFSGPDRVRYLNAILTNDIKTLQENHGVVSLFLNPQGRILAELETYAFPHILFSISYSIIREQLIPALDKYIIMDDVTLTDATDRYATLALEGPTAADVTFAVSRVELAALAELQSLEAHVSEIPARLTRRSPRGVPGVEFLVGRSHVEDLWQVLDAAVRRVGGGPTGYTALNTLRLESGVPWFDYDFGEKQIPHEAGLEHSHISYTKGCYTGQEIVERVRSRGHVNRVRVSLQFEGTEPAANTPLLADGKEVGYITRTGFSPARKAWIGMGLVRREKSAIGTILSVSNGNATVVANPPTT